MSKDKQPHKLFENIKKTFGIAWLADKKLVVSFIVLTVIGALVPIGISYSFKLLIDELIRIQTLGGIFTVALISFFAFRYVLELIDDLQSAIQYQYLDRIFRFKLENYTTHQF